MLVILLQIGVLHLQNDDGGDIIIFNNNSIAGLYIFLTVAKSDVSPVIGTGDNRYRHLTVSHVDSSSTLNGSSGEFGNECAIQYVKKGAIRPGLPGAANPQAGPAGPN